MFPWLDRIMGRKPHRIDARSEVIAHQGRAVVMVDGIEVANGSAYVARHNYPNGAVKFTELIVDSVKVFRADADTLEAIAKDLAR